MCFSIYDLLNQYIGGLYINYEWKIPRVNFEVLGFSRGNKNLKKIQAVALRFTKVFHRDLFTHKTLANINFKALRLLYAYLYDSPFQMSFQPFLPKY